MSVVDRVVGVLIAERSTTIEEPAWPAAERVARGRKVGAFTATAAFAGYR